MIGGEPITLGRGAAIVALLEARGGVRTCVEIESGEVLDVWDVAWSRDYGNEWEHLHANISPAKDDRPIHLIPADEITRISDPVTDEELFRR